MWTVECFLGVTADQSAAETAHSATPVPAAAAAAAMTNCSRVRREVFNP